MEGSSSTATLDWLSIGGQVDTSLATELRRRVAAHIRAGEFSTDNVAYIEKVTFLPIEGDLTVGTERLERLRKLCQLWDVKLRPAEITSHRKIIGPFIVAAKKLAYPVLRAFFKDTLHQQRSFNAAAIALLAELSEDIERLKKKNG